METHAEVNRLREVYRRYEARGLGRSKWSPANEGNRAIEGELESGVHRALEAAGLFPLEGRRILDVGCGTGEHLATFEAWGARPEDLFGVDLLADRIRLAREKHPRLTFQAANAEAIPFPDASFDLVAVFTVFTSILNPRMAGNVSNEIQRLLAVGGAVLWYDFRIDNPFNSQVRGVSRKRLQGLFPGFKLSIQSITLLPPLARRLGPLTPLAYPPLRSVPFLRTHYLGLFTRA